MWVRSGERVVRHAGEWAKDCKSKARPDQIHGRILGVRGRRRERKANPQKEEAQTHHERRIVEPDGFEDAR